MKFTLNSINQAGIVAAGLEDKTDVIDWVILDYIFDWKASPKALVLDDRVWISYSHLVKEMPLLGIKDKGAVSRRIKKLKELDLIDTFQCPKDMRLYAKTTAFYYEIIKFQASVAPVDLKQHPLTTVNTPVDLKQHPVDERQHTTVIPINSNTKEQGKELSADAPTPKKAEPAKKPTAELLADYGITGDIAKDFITHRQAKKAAITKTSLDGFQREAQLAGITIDEAIRYSIERNWQGFNAKWYQRDQGPLHQAPGTSLATAQTQSSSGRVSWRASTMKAQQDAINSTAKTVGGQ